MQEVMITFSYSATQVTHKKVLSLLWQ